MGLVVGHHHRAAAGDHGLPLLVDVGVVGHRLRIEGNDIFPVGGQGGHHGIAAPVGVHIVAVLHRHAGGPRRPDDGEALTHRLAEGDAVRMRDHRAGASPGQLVAGGVMAIADLGVAEAAVVVQGGAAVAASSLVAITLLNRVEQIWPRRHRAIQRHLLRGIAIAVRGGVVAHRAVGQRTTQRNIDIE